MQHAFYSSMIVSKAPQNIKSVEDSSRKNGKDPRRISSIVLVLFRLYSFPLQRTSLHFSELSSTPASHLVPYGSLGMLLSSFSEVQRMLVNAFTCRTDFRSTDRPGNRLFEYFQVLSVALPD